MAKLKLLPLVFNEAQEHLEDGGDEDLEHRVDRIGALDPKLEPGEDIVLVIAASAHREAAFEACHFLIDWLKTKAPFWKLEENDAGASWVAAKDSDDDAAKRWVT